MDSNGYDATGLSSSILAAGLLIPTIVGVYFLRSKHTARKPCKCTYCTRFKKTAKIDKYRVLFFVLLALLVLPVYNILSQEYNRSTTKDPYKTLGVSNSVDDKGVEKAYRKAVRKTKLSRMEKAEEKKTIQEILKAKDLLLDREARDRWDSFGDAPTTKSHIIAIPSWLMTKYNPVILIFLYVLILGVLLPKGVSYIWMYSFEYSSSGILYRSTESLYKALKKAEVADIIGLLVLLNRSTAELSEYAPKTPPEAVEKLREIIRRKYPLKIPMKTETFALSLGLLLLRDAEVLPLISPQDIEYLQAWIVLSTHAVKALSTGVKNRDLYYTAGDLEKCIIQAVPTPKYYQMQGGRSFEEVFLSDFEGSPVEERTPVDEEMFRVEISGMEMYNAEDGSIKDNGFITGTMDTVVRVFVEREGESVYTPAVIPRASEKACDTGDLEELEAGGEELFPSALEKYPILVRSAGEESVHAPMFFEERAYTWKCVLELNEEILMESYAFTPGRGGSEIFFKVPPMKNLIVSRRAEVQARLVCTNYFNRDRSRRMSAMIK
ncbi:translocation protein SEC63 [Nematocida major]|uniref:translocation protein SEC63 n=1 Tax=Nematocida major TaxID=1912982 RepID=UPI0020087E8D|nr:translocation protein SEC63 [Nematocida major]KAH9387253.1 translocation protein SEC63 [Nematocida major]